MSQHLIRDTASPKDPHESDGGLTVDEALCMRRSVRQFLPRPVRVETVMEILDVAARSPSGHNTQPWKVHVLVGDALRALSARLVGELQLGGPPPKPEFDAYPPRWVSPYIDRRRQVGKDMYALLGIPRGDTEAMRQQLERNYTFFEAPVGLIFALERVMVPGSVMDLGMFLQSIMLAASSRGLDTCAQAAFAPFHPQIVEQLGIGGDHLVICGMSMGHGDQEGAVNRLVTVREPALAFTTVHSRPASPG